MFSALILTQKNLALRTEGVPGEPPSCQTPATANCPGHRLSVAWAVGRCCDGRLGASAGDAAGRPPGRVGKVPGGAQSLQAGRLRAARMGRRQDRRGEGLLRADACRKCTRAAGQRCAAARRTSLNLWLCLRTPHVCPMGLTQHALPRPSETAEQHVCLPGVQQAHFLRRRNRARA